ncbi:hypothetical protein HELRODRAFT_191199 [Helobdella robusta]|uniref:Uncharacterized protein n=1 Tax=Helobdella robusta TaxID=6412 RepID=T1FSQ7_HELRO|nr:hypothetical protein HELRODRAFT_191199 [Helobdella robusta]ESO06793.1 hypothetical protein HELRODRAFT_191199 [Helobdella robusta]
MDPNTLKFLKAICKMISVRSGDSRELFFATNHISCLLQRFLRGAKRVLRSNEIQIPASGMLDTELDLSFSLQRDCNYLQILIQRRKKYKNRAMPGYKTLASGKVNMSHILQHSCDQELKLFPEDSKESANPVAMVMMMSLSSQPVDHVINRRQIVSTDADRSPGEMSDDDDVIHDEYSSNDDTSDVEMMMTADDDNNPVMRKTRKARDRFMIRQQRNFKEKFAALLKRFKVSEEVLESAVQDLGGDNEIRRDDDNVDDLFEDVENLSESDPDIDALSVRSTPKPKLRPFFSGRGGSNTCLDDRRNNHDWSVDEMGLKKSDDTNQENGKIDRNGLNIMNNNTNNIISNSSTANQSNIPNDAFTPVRRKTSKQFSAIFSPPAFFKTPKNRNRSSSFADKMYLMSNNNKCVNNIYNNVEYSYNNNYNNTASSFNKDNNNNKQSRRCSTSACEVLPRRIFMEQMSSILSCDHNSPEVIVMLLAQALQSTKHRTICTCSPSEVRTIVSTIASKIQKCTNKSLTQELPIKVAIVGGDKYISSVLRPYVELFSNKSSDWINYIRFLVVPLGPSIIGKNLSSIDNRYAGLFNDSAWKDNVFERFDFSNRFNQSMDIGEVATRIVKYLNNARHMIQLPLSEAILTNKDKGIDDSSHLIVPFLGEVRLGVMDVGNTSNIFSSLIDYDETSNANASLSNSPPQSSHMISHMTNMDKVKENISHTPPESNNFLSTPTTTTTASSTTTAAQNIDAFNLQVDYWLMSGTSSQSSNATSNLPTNLFNSDLKSDLLTNITSSASGKFLSKKDLKCSLKMMFRSVKIFRNSGLQLSGDGSLLAGGSNAGLSMVVVTREKKQKIMRIGKRSKESELNKSQQIDGISRLICTSRSQNHPLNVTIDGVDWSGIKFFQVSSQWQTHIKYFPVLIFGDLSSTTNTAL